MGKNHATCVTHKALLSFIEHFLKCSIIAQNTHVLNDARGGFVGGKKKKKKKFDGQLSSGNDVLNLTMEVFSSPQHTY